jgi:hypothetical protein
MATVTAIVLPRMSADANLFRITTEEALAIDVGYVLEAPTGEQVQVIGIGPITVWSPKSEWTVIAVHRAYRGESIEQEPGSWRILPVIED